MGSGKMTLMAILVVFQGKSLDSIPDFFTPRWNVHSAKYGSFPETERLEMLQKSREMFTFAYDSYMKHAFPKDELDPIHCTGRGPDLADPSNININDVLGDYSLSLVDSLGTLAVMGNATEFLDAVKKVVDHVSFDKPSTVQIFEANIRMLGGLLSAHLLIEDAEKTFGDLRPDWYAGDLLTMAHDLADRLVTAFEEIPLGIPHPRVNLMTGPPKDGRKTSCLAGAGSLVLEFGILSRLLGDPVYESHARRATRAVWQLRNNVTGLFGNDIDIVTGEWLGREAGLGAGMDSFYEYLLKSYVLFEEKEDLEMFLEAYGAIKEHMRRGRRFCNEGQGPHPHYTNVDMENGQTANGWIDSLQAAIAGLQVLHGDVEEAICHHAFYYAIWKKFGCLPERFNWRMNEAEVRFYPLRPEFIESTYLLYQATKNPFYLHVGRDVLMSLNDHTKAECGYATVHDVHDKSLEDRQESFFLSETCKYLYLLFDFDNPINAKKHSERFLFSTEGHVFQITENLRTKVWETEGTFSKEKEAKAVHIKRSKKICDNTSPSRFVCDQAGNWSNPEPVFCENRGPDSPFTLPLQSNYLVQVFSQLGVVV